ncbi:hypothetical protein [Nocardia bovistercoris]|uniref:Uncharacterized protein n=1 Tax=Nocardia bovistercoris TaxID=2785916 RepID=A0A931IA11_9NOCA|nr:hypothetical protein [Nocardia bovistercoris]MBH0776806.1 hypothetical protein [Nocardia bovistercoris]
MYDSGARVAHFVGSFPAGSTEEAMRAILDGAGSRLFSLPTGETGRYEWYITPIIEDLVAQGVLEVKRHGTARSSRERTIHRVPDGVELTGEAMELGYRREAEEALPLFRRFRAERDLPGLALQIGMPTDFTLAFIALGPGGIRAHRAAFRDATVRDIAAIRAAAGDDVVVQLEATAEMISMVKARPLHRIADAAVGLGKNIAALAAAAPSGTRFGVHLCLGSMNNRSRAIPRDARPLVDLANSVVRQWPSGRPLEYLHGPLAAGAVPPATDARFYAPLRELDLPPGTRFIAGCVHETPSWTAQLDTLRMIEDALGRPVDGVASACGLGRRPRTVADAMVARAAALCVAP